MEFATQSGSHLIGTIVAAKRLANGTWTDLLTKLTTSQLTNKLLDGLQCKVCQNLLSKYSFACADADQHMAEEEAPQMQNEEENPAAGKETSPPPLVDAENVKEHQEKENADDMDLTADTLARAFSPHFQARCASADVYFVIFSF